MPDLKPFRGIRYTDAAGEPSTLLAPPYDVIGPAQHLAFCQQSPHNIAHLILGTRTTASGEMPASWYGEAAARLQGWVAGGIVATDDVPALYVYTQAFEYGGRPHRRKLLLGALRLEPYGTGRVLPHERTMPGPKADRLRVMQTCRANLSPILAFSPDHSGRLIALLDALDAQPPTLAFADADGIGHELRCVFDPSVQAELSQAIEPDPLYIADGHHRYETALAYQQLQRQEEVTAGEDAPCDFMLAACMSGADPGMVIRPTHRMVCWDGAPDAAALLDSARGAFDVEPMPDAAAPEAIVGGFGDASVAEFVVYAGRATGYARLTTRDDGAMAQCPYPPSSPLRTLPAAVFRHGLVDRLLGTADAAITYTADAGEAVRRVDSGDARLAGLLPAVRPEQLMAIVDAGGRMPPKSTYFWPKPLTGLVMRSLASFQARKKPLAAV